MGSQVNIGENEVDKAIASTIGMAIGSPNGRESIGTLKIAESVREWIERVREFKSEERVKLFDACQFSPVGYNEIFLSELMSADSLLEEKVDWNVYRITGYFEFSNITTRTAELVNSFSGCSMLSIMRTKFPLGRLLTGYYIAKPARSYDNSHSIPIIFSYFNSLAKRDQSDPEIIRDASKVEGVLITREPITFSLKLVADPVEYVELMSKYRR